MFSHPYPPRRDSCEQGAVNLSGKMTHQHEEMIPGTEILIDDRDTSDAVVLIPHPSNAPHDPLVRLSPCLYAILL